MVNIENTIEKEKNQNEQITMTRVSYQNRIGRAYNMGRVDTLLMMGKTVQEIAKLLGLNESTVRSIEKRCSKCD